VLAYNLKNKQSMESLSPYQDESRFADAALNYRHYLQQVADTSLDRLRIARRLTEVEKLQAALPH
jgi:hypothetical protein